MTLPVPITAGTRPLPVTGRIPEWSSDGPDGPGGPGVLVVPAPASPQVPLALPW
jgi:hypothetical protein